MNVRTIAACLAVAALLVIGCDAVSRHKVLTTFFDGVPPLEPAESPEDERAGAAVVSRIRRAVQGAHGPYAAKMCSACHASAARNTLVAPREELCFRCHELNLQKRYIHGPLASGGCTVCHDPHSSRYRYLLLSESDSFCSHCHEPQSIARVAAHAGAGDTCTTCHDAHMSDKKYLLR